MGVATLRRHHAAIAAANAGQPKPRPDRVSIEEADQMVRLALEADRKQRTVPPEGDADEMLRRMDLAMQRANNLLGLEALSFDDFENALETATPVSEQIATSEAKAAELEAKIVDLEKKLADAEALLAEATKPAPVETKTEPAAPVQGTEEAAPAAAETPAPEGNGKKKKNADR